MGAAVGAGELAGEGGSLVDERRLRGRWRDESGEARSAERARGGAGEERAREASQEPHRRLL